MGKTQTGSVTIGLVGDFDESIPAHRAIPIALENAAKVIGIPVRWEWIPTEEIDSVGRVVPYDGLWVVPGSPYRNMDGALVAIRHARESGIPFLGTCGGFQHAVVEYARNVLGWEDAEHAETSPDAPRAVITPLECSLVEKTAPVRLREGSQIAAAYNASEAVEGYRCRYGLNPAFQETLLVGPLQISAEDETGEVRELELTSHPFFLATLFQPERAALRNEPVPLAEAFLRACVEKGG